MENNRNYPEIQDAIIIEESEKKQSSQKKQPRRLRMAMTQ